MNRDCLAAGLTEANELFEDFDPGSAFFLAFVLAVAVAPIVLAVYQRRVEHWMGSRPKGAGDAPGEPITWQRLTSGLPVSTSAAKRVRRIEWRTRLLAVALFAGLAAIQGALVLQDYRLTSPAGAFDSALNLLWGICFAGGLCAPLVLTGSRRPATGLWIAAAVLLLAATFASILFGEPETPGETVVALVGGALVVAGFLAALRGRRLRNVVPVLTLFLFALLAGFLVFGWWVALVGECDSCLLLFGGFLFGVGSFTLAAFLAYRILAWLSHAYESKRFSDAQLQLGCWAVVVVLAVALEVDPRSDASIFSVPALWVFAAALLALWFYRRGTRDRAPSRPPVRLLLLRVFSSESRGQRLLDDLGDRWSFLGPVYLVGGPDLAKLYLEPHELVLLLRRRLREAFVLDREGLGQRLAETDDQPDRDARYRVHEFFCSDDVWRDAVLALVGGCERILLDLRGFDESRQGTAYELELLARARVLDRTLLLVDEATDMELVDEVLAGVEGASRPEGKTLRVGRLTTGAELAERLFAGA